MSITWTRASISTRAALAVLAAGVDAAEAAGLAATIVIVDDSGAVKATVRMDGASSFTAQAAHDKGFTAACSGMPTAMWDSILEGNAFAAARLTSAIDRINILPGGLPLTVDGSTVGAIGVSGGTDEQDASVAAAAAAALVEA